MGTELRVRVPGEAVDARQAVWILDRLLGLLEALETEAAGPGSHTAWTFTHMGLGSVVAAVAPNRPRLGRSIADVECDISRLVDGFDTAEQQEGVPAGWNRDATARGAEIGKMLGALHESGLEVSLLANGQAVRVVTVTRRTGDNLSAVLRARKYSIGSVVGRLDSASAHTSKVARLWTLTPPNRSVEVRFNDDQIETIRHAWYHRVEVLGKIERDAWGNPFRITMRSLDILPSDSPPLTALVGLDPNLTGGLDPSEHLRDLRGTA